MKIKELKEILNESNEMDELEIYVSPMVEIDQLNSSETMPAKTRRTASIFERYPMTGIQRIGIGGEIEGKRFNLSMVIGFDPSINLGAKRPEKLETNEFVN